MTASLRDRFEALAAEVASVCEEGEVAGTPEAASARDAVQAVRGYLTAGTYAGRKLEKAEAALLAAQVAVEALRGRASALGARADAAIEASRAARAAAQGRDPLAQRMVVCTGDVTIECAVDIRAEERERLVERMREAIAACPGPWTVDLSAVEGQGWWALRIVGSGFRWVCTFQGDAEREPDHVAARIRTAMQIAVLQRELGRRRHT